MVQNCNTDSVKRRRIAIIASEGFDGAQLTQVKERLEAEDCW